MLADLRGWERWGDWSETAVEREGDDAPGGVGALRALRHRPFTTRERVTGWDPPVRFAYELVSGMPLRVYRCEVTLSDAAGGGTDIRWQSELEPKIPGTGGMFRRALAKFIADTAARLAREAERQAATGSGRPPAPSHSRP